MGSSFLVVDSSARERWRLAALLKHHFAVDLVAQADSMTDALIGLAESPAIDIVLIDPRLPDMRGPACIARLCRARPDIRPIVFAQQRSADSDNEYLDAGARAVIQRRAPEVDLLIAVKRVVRNAAPRPALVTAADGANLREPKSYVPKAFPWGGAIETIPLLRLTPRQRQVLELLCEGERNRAIANRLGLSESTVKMHVSRIYRSLNANTRVQASVRAMELGLRVSTPRRRPLPGATGFSLIELLVVVAIIGLLASYAGPKLFNQIAKSERETARAQIDAFSKALDAYRIDTGSYPANDPGLRALVERPANAPRWRGPYLQKGIPPDPWGNAYSYANPGRHGEIDIVSLGRDGRPGGTEESADLGNWQ